VLYAVASWLILQVADVLFDALELPPTSVRLVLAVLILGFPLTLIVSWVYEMTPEGLKRDKDVDRSNSVTHATGRKINILIIVLLVFAIAAVAVDRLVPEVSQTVERPTIAAITDKSIAVLPFVNMSDDPNNEYFADGISEEILNLLANVRELRVTSRSSAFSFKGQNLDVPTMAAKLNVAHVLEGSVRKSGNQVRITTQLIEVDTDKHLWSQTYDRELKNIFTIQDEIAAAVVDALKITLLGEKPKSHETNPDAYTLYLKAVFLQNQGTLASNQQAETLLTQALKIDPNFAPAWALLSLVVSNQAWGYGVRPVDEAEELARNAIRTALELDPQYGRAYATLGDIEIHFGWNFTAASNYMQQALKLNPGDAYILSQAAHLEIVLGRTDEAIDLYRQVVALDPLVPGGHNGLGRTYYLTGRLEEAADSMRLGRSLAIGQSAGLGLSFVLLAQGNTRAALAEIEQLDRRGNFLFEMAIIQHALGDTKASDAALEELITNFGGGNWDNQIAQIHAYRGEIDDAFEWLDAAYENRDTGLPFMLLEPLLRNLHDDPRWAAFLDKMGLPH